MKWVVQSNIYAEEGFELVQALENWAEDPSGLLW